MSTIPNHCSNSLTVTGPAEDVDTFFTAVAAGPDDNFINTFIPMPDILTNIWTGVCTIDGVQVTEWTEGPDGKPVALSPVDRQHIIDVCGTADSLVWTRSKWGTKWGAYSVDVDRGSRRILYDTAWGPAIPAIDTISRLYPTLSLEMAWAEGGMGFYGTVTYTDGEEFNAFDANDSFWNEDEDAEDPVTPHCRDFLDLYGLTTGG